MEYPTLAGNLAAIMTGLIVSVCVSLAKPERFDWESTRLINSSTVSTPSSTTVDDRKAQSKKSSDLPTVVDEEKDMRENAAAVEEPSKLRRAFKVACIASFLLTFAMDFLLPIPMFLSHYVFSQGFFIAWVVITFCWVFCSTAISVILPVWETAGFFRNLYREVVKGERATR